MCNKWATRKLLGTLNLRSNICIDVQNRRMSWILGQHHIKIAIVIYDQKGRSEDQILVGRDFPPVQTSPGGHPASCTMGTGSFPGVKCGQGVLLTTLPLLVLPSWKSRAIPLPTLWATAGPVKGTLYLTYDQKRSGRNLLHTSAISTVSAQCYAKKANYRHIWHAASTVQQCHIFVRWRISLSTDTSSHLLTDSNKSPYY